VRRVLCMSCLLLVWVGSTTQTQARTDDPYPMVSSLIHEARSLRLAGDLFGSEARLVRAQRIAPRSSDVYLELAYLRKDQGDYTGLRDVVEFGANVSDGPSGSLAQLRALKSKLAVLLPLDSETPFSLPPVARDEVLDRQKIDQSVQDSPSTVALNAEEKSMSEEATPRPLDQPAPVLAEKLVQVKTEERPASDELVSKATPGTETKTSRPETASGPEIKPLEDEPRADNKSRTQESMVPSGSASDSGEQKSIVAKPEISPEPLVTSKRLVQPASDETARESLRDIKPERRSSDKSSVGAGFVGLGILGRPQSGAWMSTGPIETEY
jgi:hypothetical protein